MRHYFIKLGATLSLILAAVFSSAGAAQQDSQNPSLSCFQSLADKPELQSIRDKVALSDVRVQSLEMLANDKRPTKSERAALSVWVNEVEECKNIGNDWMAKNSAVPISSLLDQYFIDMKSLTADLYSGKMTYGSYAKKRATSFASFNSALSQLSQKLAAERKAEQQIQSQQLQLREEKEAALRQERELREAEMESQNQQARRNAALLYLQNQRQVQPPQIQFHPIPINPTTSTQCNPNGFGGFNCTTR